MQTKTYKFVVKRTQFDERGETVRIEQVGGDDQETPRLTLASKAPSGLKFGDELEVTIKKLVKN